MEVETLLLLAGLEGDTVAGILGEGVGRERVSCRPGVKRRSGQTQSICRRLQLPHVGRDSSHLTRRDLHFVHPFLDLRWPTLAGLARAS